jgi:hypothetical protein
MNTRTMYINHICHYSSKDEHCTSAFFLINNLQKREILNLYSIEDIELARSQGVGLLDEALEYKYLELAVKENWKLNEVANVTYFVFSEESSQLTMEEFFLCDNDDFIAKVFKFKDSQ